MHTLIRSKSFSFTVASLIVLGVAIHDTKIDAATALTAIPVAMIAADPGKTLLGKSMAHTHVERVAFSRTVSKHTSWMPRIKAQGDHDGQRQLSKKVPRGHHPFDNYSLPVLS